MAKKSKKAPTEHINLDFTPHIHQAEFFRNWKRYNELICTRRFGKTVIGGMALSHYALDLSISRQDKQPKFAYIAPQKDQAKQITWPIFKQFLAPLIQRNMVIINNQSMEVYFRDADGKPWGQIKLYAEEKDGCESIRGNYLDGVVFDEYDSMDASNVYDEIVAPALEDTDGWVLFGGTIKGKANLYNLYKENYGDPEWNIGIYRFEDTWQDLPAYCDFDAESNLWIPAPRKYERIIKRYKNKPNKFAREYQCDWNADGIDSLIANDVLQGAIGKHIRETEYADAPRIMGIDVAGDGPDSHSICKRQGNACSPIRLIKDCTEKRLSAVVANEANTWEPDMIFVDTTGGYGTELVSRLRDLGFHNVRGINFGSKAIETDRFMNIRTEMAFKTKDWLENGGCLPDDPQLEQELSVLSSETTGAGKAMLIKKDDIRELIGRSPDSADSLMLTFAEPVMSKARMNNQTKVKTVASTGYRPLDNRRRRGHGLFR